MALTKISRGLLDTGVSDSSDSTAITIDSSENVQFAGNVGIGVAPTHNFNQQAAGAVEARFRSTDNDCFLQISSDTDEGQDSVLQFLSGTTTRGSIIYDHNTTQGSQNMIFKTGDNTKSVMTLTGGGDFSFNLGTGDTGNRYMIINSGASNDGGIVLKRENTNKWQINNTTSDDDLAFYSYGTSSTVLYLDRSSGAVGMGFTGQISGATLSVYSSADGGVVIGSSSGSNAFRKIYHDPSAGILYFTSTSNAPYLSNAGGWTNASDISIKKDIIDIDYGLSTVESLQPRRYKMKADDENQVGFIAQEMESVIPELVSGEENKKGINYGQLTAVLTKAIQELKTELDAAKARIETLENA